jgi:pSer/pThr/pTyr-binding forkhead associated (FHA) protein
MASALVVGLVKYGLLLLLWLFVVSAFRTVRADLYGARPAAAAASAPAAPRPARTRSAARTLVVTEGALAGTTLTLTDAPITLGRADESTLVLTDDYASTRHARLVPGESAWMVEDLGSTNGTFLDGRKVAGPTPVPLGQPIKIGTTVLELRR